VLLLAVVNLPPVSGLPPSPGLVIAIVGSDEDSKKMCLHNSIEDPKKNFRVKRF
jgi:hypothetical protein